MDPNVAKSALAVAKAFRAWNELTRARSTNIEAASIAWSAVMSADRAFEIAYRPYAEAEKKEPCKGCRDKKEG